MPAPTTRSLRGIRTTGALADRRKSRTRAGALLELSVLANEKERLTRELRRWEQRKKEIEARLAEISEKERRLEEAAAAPAPVAAPAAPAPELRMKPIQY